MLNAKIMRFQQVLLSIVFVTTADLHVIFKHIYKDFSPPIHPSLHLYIGFLFPNRRINIAQNVNQN